MIQEFFPSLDHLHEMISFVRRCGLEAGFYESNMYQIELAVEEALVNIISYGFIGKKGMIQIDCKSKEPKYFRITICDAGIPYNPLNSGRMFDLSTILEGKSLGGYGVFFILKIMDEIKYRYESGKNVLTLAKYKETEAKKD